MDSDATYILRDSGERREYSTGSVRDRQRGKGRYDLFSPIAMRRIADVYEKGAVKYAARNWEKGQPIAASFLDSALRHIYQNLEGLRDEDHLAQAAWNLIAAIHVETCIQRGLLPPELDDRPSYLSVLTVYDDEQADAKVSAGGLA